MDGKEDKRMISRIPVLLFAVLMLLPLMPAETSAVVTGEEGLFSAVAPDTVIVLDISASMQTNPMDSMDGRRANRTSSTAMQTAPGRRSTTRPRRATTTNCPKFLIAQRAIFNVLDDNKDGVINSQDDSSLNIRMGFYAFNSSVYKMKDIGKSYANIFCGKSSCSLSNPYDYSGTGNVLHADRRSESGSHLQLQHGHRPGPRGGQDVPERPQGGRHLQKLPPEVRHPRHRRRRHEVLRRKRRRQPDRPVQAEARLRPAGQGPGRRGLQGLRHRPGPIGVPVPAQDHELDGLPRRHGQPARGEHRQRRLPACQLFFLRSMHGRLDPIDR